MIKITVNEFSKRALKRSGIELYTVEDAISLVKLCQLEEIPILGIDAFSILGDKIRPSMEYSIDLSNKTNRYDIAIKFLKDSCNFDFLYEVVY